MLRDVAHAIGLVTSLVTNGFTIVGACRRRAAVGRSRGPAIAPRARPRPPKRSQSSSAAARNIGEIGRTLLAAAGAAVTRGGASLAALEQASSSSLTQATTGVAARLESLRDAGVQGFLQAASRTGKALADSATHAASELSQAKRQFMRAAQDGARQATAGLHRQVGAGLTQQASNLRTAEAHQQRAGSQIASRY